MSILYIKDTDGKFIPVQTIRGADGKTAYEYAREGGYSGTEAEFAAKLAKEIPDAYTLPTASETVKGGVKVGKGLAMEGESLNAEVEKADIDKLSEEKADKFTLDDSLTLVDGVLGVKTEIMELIEHVVYSENSTATIVRTSEPNGTPLALKELLVVFDCPAYPTGTITKYPEIHLISGKMCKHNREFYYPTAERYVFIYASVKDGVFESTSNSVNKVHWAPSNSSELMQMTTKDDVIHKFTMFNSTESLIIAGTEMKIYGVRA